MGIVTPSTKRVSNPLLGSGTELIVELPNTADGGDTFTITMADYGCTTFLAFYEVIHTTEGSIVVPATQTGGTGSTTSVSSGVITFTLSGSTTNQKRVFIIWMKA